MTNEDFIIQLFCLVNERRGPIPKVPNELVTIDLLFVLNGGCFRACCRWLRRDHDDHFAELTQSWMRLSAR